MPAMQYDGGRTQIAASAAPGLARAPRPAASASELCAFLPVAFFGHGSAGAGRQARAGDRTLAQQARRSPTAGRQPEEHDRQGRRPAITGKPTANRFSVGAARLMTPKAMFTISSAVTPGSAMRSAPENSCDPHCDDRPQACVAETARADRQGAKALRPESRSARRWPFEREESQRHQQRVELPQRRRLAPRSGSMLKAKARPMPLARSWPPSVRASNISCSAKPSATPMTTCCTVTMSAGGGEGRDAARARHQRRDEQRDRRREHDADARRHDSSRRTPAPP